LDFGWVLFLSSLKFKGFVPRIRTLSFAVMVRFPECFSGYSVAYLPEWSSEKHTSIFWIAQSGTNNDLTLFHLRNTSRKSYGSENIAAWPEFQSTNRRIPDKRAWKDMGTDSVFRWFRLLIAS
jgi:hypothetical protein